MPAAKKPAASKKQTAAKTKPAKKKVAAKPKVLTAREKLEKVGIEAICERIADLEFYANIAASIGVSRGSLMAYLNDYPDMYARAREARADKMAEEILEIADESRYDTIVDKEGNERMDSEYVQRSKLRVDSRKWLASKMFPKRYGDVTRLEGSTENPVVVDHNVTLTADWDNVKAMVAAKVK